MLSKLNKINCSHIIENKFYHSWILELLLPYQQSATQERLSGPSLAVYDIGTKLYTIVLLHSLISEPRNRFIPYLARWPLIVRYKLESGKYSGESKEGAYQLTKHLMSSVIKLVANEASK